MPSPKLSLAELDTAVEGFVATYNYRTHSEIGTSPRSAWIAGGWLPRMPESLEALDELLLTVAKTASCAPMASGSRARATYLRPWPATSDARS